MQGGNLLWPGKFSWKPEQSGGAGEPCLHLVLLSLSGLSIKEANQRVHSPSGLEQWGLLRRLIQQEGTEGCSSLNIGAL